MVWAIRGQRAERTFGGGEAAALPARGALGTRLHDLVTSGRVVLLTGFGIERFDAAGGRVTVTAGDEPPRDG